jgi:hypothetical protein
MRWLPVVYQGPHLARIRANGAATEQIISAYRRMTAAQRGKREAILPTRPRRPGRYARNSTSESRRHRRASGFVSLSQAARAGRCARPVPGGHWGGLGRLHACVTTRRVARRSA